MNASVARSIVNPRSMLVKKSPRGKLKVLSSLLEIKRQKEMGEKLRRVGWSEALTDLNGWTMFCIGFVR